MDPEFHIAVESVKHIVADLKLRYSADALVAKMEALPTEDLSALKPLLWGKQSTSRRPALQKAMTEYPFIAFALVQASADALLAAAQADADQALQRVRDLAAIKAS
jgi:hypothetical protein